MSRGIPVYTHTIRAYNNKYKREFVLLIKFYIFIIYYVGTIVFRMSFTSKPLRKTEM